MSLISYILPIIICIIIIFIIYYLCHNNDQQILDPTPPSKPYCPDCNSHDLKLVDTCDGLPWLKGHVKEVDYYVCNRCGRQFNDEDWYE